MKASPVETPRYRATHLSGDAWEVTDKTTRCTYKTFGTRAQIQKKLKRQTEAKAAKKNWGHFGGVY